MQKRICTCLPLLLAIVLFGGISNSEPIPQDILKCIGYLTTPISIGALDNTENNKTIGTAFLVGYQYPKNKGTSYVFLVTAKHVLHHDNGARIERILLRMNDKTTKKLKDYDIIKNDRWFFHSDNSVDLAIQPLLPRDADFLMIPNSLFVTDNTLSNNKIGLGDDVFYIGLLDYYSGVDHIIPIARFGRIALITNEKTADGMFYHFIDAGNIPGHSGSPVFLWATPSRESTGLVAGSRIFGLYGVVSGTLEYAKEIKVIMPKRTQVRPIPMDYRAGGVTAIVPVKYLDELLNDPKVVSAIGLKR